RELQSRQELRRGIDAPGTATAEPCVRPVTQPERASAAPAVRLGIPRETCASRRRNPAAAPGFPALGPRRSACPASLPRGRLKNRIHAGRGWRATGWAVRCPPGTAPACCEPCGIRGGIRKRQEFL